MTELSYSPIVSQLKCFVFFGRLALTVGGFLDLVFRGANEEAIGVIGVTGNEGIADRDGIFS